MRASPRRARSGHRLSAVHIPQSCLGSVSIQVGRSYLPGPAAASAHALVVIAAQAIAERPGEAVDIAFAALDRLARAECSEDRLRELLVAFVEAGSSARDRSGV
ncbi:hypothetical protein [Cupriavidus malaysiensis]|uniref:hypothetical protein n=1 Tax=Cupriavidus malaysiensis TaxID=367825 RepID=UPI0012FF9B79|nr:hypothetical protein [Cupriavidus malaysiensis]